MSKKFLLFTVFLSLFGILTEIGLSGFPRGVISIIEMIFVGGIITLISRWISKYPGEFRIALMRNTLIYGSIVGIFSFFLISFAGYYHIFPGALSAVHMTDGTRKVVFMQMSHIATRDYYDSVQKTLSSLTNSGFIIYYEGVMPGKKESQDRFDQALGIKISSGTYVQLAGRLGLIAQDDAIFTGIPQEKLRRVDLSIDEIAGLLGSGQTIRETPSVDPILDSFLSVEPRPLFSFIIRGFLSFSLTNLVGTDFFLDSMDAKLRDAILSGRNRHVIDALIADANQNIVIVYGALHFEGMFDMLRSHDPKWRIERLDSYYPYIE